MKKICFYSGSNELVSGDAKCMFNIINHLDKKKFSVKIISDINSKFEKISVDWLNEAFEIEYIDTMPKLFDLKFKKKVLKNLYKLFTFYHARLHIKNFIVFYKFFKKNKNRFDIFHINNGGYTGKQAALMSIVIAHFFGKVPNIILYIQNIAIKKSIFQPTDFLFDLITLRYCKKIIADSNATKKTLIKRLGESKKIITIRCGLDKNYNFISNFKYQTKDKDKILTAIIGNYEEERKGHELFIKNINKKNIDNMHVLIVGGGSEVRKQHIIKLLKSKDIYKSFTFTGYVTDISNLLNQINFLILPSTSNESIPYVLMEALRSSVPIIASNIGSNNEVIKNGYNGYLYENYTQMNEQIRKLTSDHSLLSSLSKNSYNFFIDNFSHNSSSRVFEELYNDQI